jgi:hypothetical protein
LQLRKHLRQRVFTDFSSGDDFIILSGQEYSYTYNRAEPFR